ncbi:MAG: hypothetical protein M1823_006464, partial [Watsoniomyces obsoletus]
ATYADRRRTPGPGFRRRTSSPSSNGRRSRTGCEMRLSPTACEKWRPPADTAKPRNRPDSESPSLSPTSTAWKRTWRNSQNTFGRMPFSWGYDPKLRLKSWETLPPPTTRQQVADLAIQIEEARNQATRAIGGERAHADSGPRPYRQRTDRGRPIAPSRPLPMRETTRPPYPSANEPPRGPRGQGFG